MYSYYTALICFDLCSCLSRVYRFAKEFYSQFIITLNTWLLHVYTKYNKTKRDQLLENDES